MSAVTATYTNATGDPAAGTVYLSPVARVGTSDPRIVTEKRVWADLDVNGSVSIDVLASDDPSWLAEDGVPYLVEERLTHVPFRSYWVIVPSTGLDLADAQPLDPEDIRVVAVVGEGPAGPAGPEGPQGDPGPPGAAVLSGWWQYATQTTGPAAEGEVRTDPNLGAIDSTGTLWLSSTDADGLDWSMVSPNIGDQVVLRSASGESWTLTVDAIVATGEWTVTLNSSTGTAPKRNERVQVSLVQPSMTQEQADARYVNADGDTMTGALTIETGLGVQPSNLSAPAGRKRSRLQVDGGGVMRWSALNDDATFDKHVISYNRDQNTLYLNGPANVVVPAPTAASQAAQVTAIDPTTGRLAIGGHEIGDTGQRNVVSLMSAGITASAPGVTLRRVNNTVFFDADITLDGGSWPGGTVFDPPTGFAPSRTIAIMWFVFDGSAFKRGYVNSGSIYLPAWTTAQRVNVSAHWATSETWPTTLPGVPA